MLKSISNYFYKGHRRHAHIHIHISGLKATRCRSVYVHMDPMTRLLRQTELIDWKSPRKPKEPTNQGKFWVVKWASSFPSSHERPVSASPAIFKQCRTTSLSTSPFWLLGRHWVWGLTDALVFSHTPQTGPLQTPLQSSYNEGEKNKHPLACFWSYTYCL